ncbi:MAG: GGDEF domain-containing protein [Acidobacteria bacterium ACB2]|nr:GGDEF domain-containing protein [Acidobacteria bacterium ACB2]
MRDRLALGRRQERAGDRAPALLLDLQPLLRQRGLGFGLRLQAALAPLGGDGGGGDRQEDGAALARPGAAGEDPVVVVRGTLRVLRVRLLRLPDRAPQGGLQLVGGEERAGAVPLSGRACRERERQEGQRQEKAREAPRGSSGRRHGRIVGVPPPPASPFPRAGRAPPPTRDRRYSARTLAVKLNGDSLQALLAVAEVIAYPEGAYLWHEGDAGDAAALLLEGELEVLHEVEGQDEPVHLRKVEPGTLVGELACLDGLARSASVRATSACQVARIPADRFREIVRGRHEIFAELFWEQVARVRSLTRHVTKTHHRAITDTLTGLYNFGFFQQRLGMETQRARMTGDPISLVIFDIDHFKKFNDTHGHPEGNKVLVRVAEILKGAGRRGDIVARYGGEEFAILLYGATRMDAWLLAESARQRVFSEDFPGGETQPLGRVTISGGVATLPEDAGDEEALIQAADERLYRSKEKGRNRISGHPDEA